MKGRIPIDEVLAASVLLALAQKELLRSPAQKQKNYSVLDSGGTLWHNVYTEGAVTGQSDLTFTWPHFG